MPKKKDELPELPETPEEAKDPEVGFYTHKKGVDEVDGVKPTIKVE